MDYEKKYNKLVNAIKVLQETNPSDEGVQNWVKDNVPELRESEDERIKKTLIDYFKDYKTQEVIGIETFFGIPTDDIIAWLEKQRTSKQVSIWKHWKDGIAGNGEGKPIYLIKVGNTYSLTSCLGFECDYIELSELDNLMLKKKGSAWSEEDERNLQGVIDEIEANKNQAPDYDFATYDRFLSWLKSLKNRYTWKPSNEQIIALRWVLNNIPYNKHKEEISGLLDQIIKLK